MNRRDVIRELIERIPEDALLVSNIADASFELYALGDRPRNFYMLGSFGLASSIALGLALSRDERVIAIDGDGALLYNLGTLATIGRYRPTNLLHVLVDNGVHGATGKQATAASVRTDLGAVAAACGIPVKAANDLDSLREGLRDALLNPGPCLLHVRVDEHPAQKAPLPPLSGTDITARFMNALRTTPHGD